MKLVSRRFVATAMVMTVAMLAASCGSDDEDSAATSVSAASATTAAAESSTTASESTTAPTTPDTGGASDTSAAGSGASDEVAAAQAIVDSYLAEPTKIPITTPITGELPKDETIVFMQCEFPQCADSAAALKDATGVLGWKLEVIQYTAADPATLLAGMDQALQQFDPTAVIVTGVPEAVWSSKTEDYRKAGVSIIAGFVGPAEINDTVIANIAGPIQAERAAEALANWFIVDSGGQGHGLLYQITDFPVLALFDQAFADDIKAGCAECSLTAINGSASEAATGAHLGAMVSGAQRDPSVNYVFTDSGDFAIGLPAALSAAGIDAKVAGQNANSINLTDLQAGEADAFTGLAFKYASWAMVDAVLRHRLGLPLDPNQEDLPMQLLTRDVPFEVTASYEKPADYAEQIKALWGIA